MRSKLKTGLVKKMLVIINESLSFQRNLRLYTGKIEKKPWEYYTQKSTQNGLRT